MNDVRFGRCVRAVRLRLGRRQADVGRRAGCSQSVVSDIEHGRLEDVSLRVLRRVCEAVEVDLALLPRWRGGEVDRLVDAGHAAIVDHVAAMLTRSGWVVSLEVSFNVFGERGSVDVVGWHPKRLSLVIVEVKTSLTDLQAMLLSMSRKVRHVPGILERDRGWRSERLGRLVVIAGTDANRRVVDRHRALFDATFPPRSRAARSWITDPATDFTGLWFLSPSVLGDGAAPNRRRVRAAVSPSKPGRTDLAPGIPVGG